MKTFVLCLLCVVALLASLPGCSSRPKASEEDTLYANYGGDTLRRKRTETRTEDVTDRVYNDATGKWENRTRSETKTVTVLEIERADGTIVDYEVSIGLANKLREGGPIPRLDDEQAAAAGVVGNCVRVTNVVLGATGDAAGIMEDDLIISYNGQKALGVKKLQSLVDATEPGQRVKLVVERDGQQMQLEADGGSLGVEGEDEWK